MKIDRARFFAEVRRLKVCGPTLSQTEVDGLGGILDAWERTEPDPDPRHVAYTMATAWHEARLDGTIREVGRGKGYAYGKPAGPYGHVYYGRSFPQLTWLDNYTKFGKLLGLDLVRDPDRVLVPVTGAEVLLVGSRDGLFRAGKSLKRYFSASASDPVGARDIINGDVKKNGELIAGYYRLLFTALTNARAAVASPAPTPAAVKPPPPTVPPPSGWLRRLGGWFDRVWSGPTPDLAARG